VYKRQVVGYGADPVECVRIVAREFSGSVMGNHDAVAVGRDNGMDFNPRALAAALWTRDILPAEEKSYLAALSNTLAVGDVLLCHGAPSNRNRYVMGSREAEEEARRLPKNTEVVFFGHTHVPAVYAVGNGQCREAVPAGVFSPGGPDGGVLFVNAGSVGQPRDGNPEACFCLYDLDAARILMVRVPYDAKAACGKILSAGLPTALGHRLLRGA